MAGLGTLFILLMGWRRFSVARCAIAEPSHAVAVDARVSFPYIATTAGWMTAELGVNPDCAVQAAAE